MQKSRASSISLSELFSVWLRIGLLSFGGPTAQIAMMHKELVEDRDWFTEQEFLDALSFCMLLPGPEAMQLAAYSGWKVAGTRGGLIAGLLFILPGATVIMALATLYALFGEQPLAQVLFTGVKATVLIIVLQALMRLSKKALQNRAQWLFAFCSFVALFALNLPFPLIIMIAGLVGYLGFLGGAAHQSTAPQSTFKGSLKTIGQTATLWLAIWLLPLIGLIVLAGPGDLFSQLGLFASKLAVVTFGGAYAVLSYMAQDVVQQFGWLNAGEMVDGLGLAETTPGPLILVTQFVGYLAAYKNAGWDQALLAGMAGAIVVLWCTFTPCFLWIFSGAPLLDQLNHHPKIRRALGGITTAVVGVILNLSLWFAFQVFFTQKLVLDLGITKLSLPEPASLDPKVLGLSLLSAVMLLALKWSIVRTLGLSALLAYGLHTAGF
ncbi:chromate efflux transporter [Kiloniella sp. b19]|uniref:chromate efflux transporter n=1 Tax=Kiloniella sp. GXU_MW_B19 TaxID=3141326 RepID=UPI0031D5BE88